MKTTPYVGEPCTTHVIHREGFDTFTTTEYVVGGAKFQTALTNGWDPAYIQAHNIEADFPCTPSELAACDVVIVNEVGIQRAADTTRGQVGRSLETEAAS